MQSAQVVGLLLLLDVYSRGRLLGTVGAAERNVPRAGLEM